MSPQQRVAAVVGAGVISLAWPLVRNFEGNVRTTYKDPVGLTTACTGHTQFAQLGRTYTPNECDELLAGDLWKHDADMKTCIKVPLSDQEHAAYLSFTFNVGAAKFCGSTLVQKLNSGDRAGSCAELSRWVGAAGKPLAGLIRRRAAERELCESGLHAKS